MPSHVVVDGSNIATEGRSQPSLKQLNEAVLSFMADHPEALITVVVDATFGHRIEAKEVAEFDDAVSNNELVAPPAGAIGRGDAFVLSIAHKVNASILSNDSYQEFHGQYTWLFDEGRLIGGKPVPHVGWVFVNRLPVRGPLSRKSVAEAKGGRSRKSAASAGSGTVRVGSAAASKPMPVPAAPPPGATVGRKRGRGGGAAAKDIDPVTVVADAVVQAAAPSAASAAGARSSVNDLLTFLSFVENHPVGTSVNAVVDHYSSHGAYVRIGDVVGYVPLRLMANPAPRSGRELAKVGESVTLVVEGFVGAKRSIDLAVPGMGTAVLQPPAAKPSRSRKKAVAASVEPTPVEAEKLAEKPAKKPAKKAAAAPAKQLAKAPSTRRPSAKAPSATAPSAKGARPAATTAAPPKKLAKAASSTTAAPTPPKRVASPPPKRAAPTPSKTATAAPKQGARKARSGTAKKAAG